jgi:uncharacterized protein YprB with RNaseH-like and TPR domain
MSLTLAKLQQLKRQAGAGVPARPRLQSAAPGSDVSIERLRQLLRVRSPPMERVQSLDRALPGIEIAPGLYLREERLDGGAIPEHFNGSFDRKGPLAASELLFFDTETTGLAGGTGTRAFMIGAADWHAGALRIRQLTIASMAAEAAMLDVFQTWLMPETILVSYNGKCYDAPLLATRYRLARRANPLAGLLHVDLLYPSRRRWRGMYENCRLSTIERQVLGVVREDDLPGAQAPAAWLTYLRGGSAGNLLRVMKHNSQDLISLSMLLSRLSQLSEEYWPHLR